MNDNFNTTIASLADSLSADIGIDTESATKVVNWLISEGVLDMPVVNDTFNTEAA